MDKKTAIALLGGNSCRAGRLLGCSSQNIRQWPDVLPGRLVDRVIAAIVRASVNDALRSGRRRRPDRITLPSVLFAHLSDRARASPDAVVLQAYAERITHATGGNACSGALTDG
jgi:hypothetical protein